MPFRYAAELDAEDALLSAADAGTADSAAGRHELFSSRSDFLKLRQPVIEHLDELRQRAQAPADPWAFRISARARRDPREILAYSLEYYGRAAAERHGLLVAAAIDIVS